MQQEIRTEREKRLVRKIIVAAVRLFFVLLIVTALTLFAVFLPLRSLLPAYAIPAREEGELRIHFLAMGEGDCNIIEFPDGELLVIDAGAGDFDHTNKLFRYINGLSFTALSCVATRAEATDCGGFIPLINAYGVQTVYLPVLNYGYSRYEKFEKVARAKAERVETLTRYAVLENRSGAYCVCLSPYSIDESDKSDSSAVLYLEYCGVRVLLSGNITAAREERLLQDYALTEGIFDSGDHTVTLEEIDILKVSRRGASNASSEAWLALISPAVAVITGGAGNRYHYPAADTVKRLSDSGAELYRTDELGAVVVSIKKEGYRVC